MANLITAEFRKDLYLLITNTYIAYLEEISPVKEGNLKRSWFLKEVEPLVFEITNDAEYAEYIDAGTGLFATKGFDADYAAVPGRKVIEPTTKKALAFKAGGVNIVVRSVKGIKPLKMLMKVTSSVYVEREFEAGLEELFGKHFFHIV